VIGLIASLVSPFPPFFPFFFKKSLGNFLNMAIKKSSLAYPLIVLIVLAVILFFIVWFIQTLSPEMRSKFPSSFAEAFASFRPTMPCPSTPRQILSRVNGVAPARGATGNRGALSCVGNNAMLFPTDCGNTGSCPYAN